MLGNRAKLLYVLLPLLVFSAANAAPTLSNCNSNLVVTTISPTSNEYVTSVPEIIQIAELSDSHLARVAAEFLKPPAVYMGSSPQPVGARSLPAVPGALLMGLTGFLCVSLVKDRRFWLAALTSLLWVGQAGIQAVPQLAMHLGHRNHNERQFDAELIYPYYLENSDRLRSDIEGTQYIGLLHHLAGIPNNSVSFLQSRLSFLRKQESSQTEDEFRAPQFARMGLSSQLIHATKCLAVKVEQIIYFSPAFIFENLPRGPPKLT
ncbi:MAG: hypothetical protein ACYTDW_03060 [Planctomycetota bacterium]